MLSGALQQHFVFDLYPLYAHRKHDQNSWMTVFITPAMQSELHFLDALDHSLSVLKCLFKTYILYWLKIVSKTWGLAKHCTPWRGKNQATTIYRCRISVQHWSCCVCSLQQSHTFLIFSPLSQIRNMYSFHLCRLKHGHVSLSLNQSVSINKNRT